MTTYTIYTTAKFSYIVPNDKLKLPKKVYAQFEIDSPIEICDHRCRLAAKVTTFEHVKAVIARLAEPRPDILARDHNTVEKVEAEVID